MAANGLSLSEVLVVDDEPQVLTALKDFLEDEYSVHLQTSAETALKFLARTPGISVIISDQRMPEMSGDQFLARAREISGATRVLITGYADLKAVIRSINEGRVFGYISKPWEPNHLRVTVHKAVEYYEMTRELIQERALLHNLMDSLPDMVFFKDTAHKYLKVNHAKAMAMGIAGPDEAVGKTDAAFSMKEAALATEREEDEIFRTNRPIVDQIERIVTADGAEHWFSATKAPVLSDRGDIISLVCVARDITERHRAQQALSESERRYRALYNKTPVMMQSIDRDGRLISVSDHWCETLGYERDEVLGRRSVEFMDDETRKRLEDVALPEFFRTGRIKDVECRFVRKDGRIVDTLMSAIAEYDESAKYFRSLSVIIDVTEKIALQGQLLQAQKMEAVGQLTGGVAHDFNNLLSIILGNLEFLEERVRYDEPLRKFATVAQHAANRGADLTRRLLAFSRRQVLEPVNVDMNAAVSGLAGMITRTLGEHIEVQTVLALGLWETRIDPAQLESTLLNLCVNARDAMPDGGKLTIETANVVLDSGYAMQFPDVKSGDYVLLTVSDRGTGMSREIVERAFEPFFTTKERDKGTGLGLSMVYGFVKQSGGHITISSELGRGTSVTLYFPRADSASTRREPAAAVMSEPKGTETILVVEDEPDVRRTVVGMLRSLGYRVLVAENGPTALNILENAANDVDLLFTDLIMSGGMNGLELAEKVQVLRPGLHVLYTSGYADGAVRGKENILRDKQLIAKPYVRQVLAERVRQSLDR